ncbi:MAG TPA: hypothetical protein DG048_24290 [Pseudoalteromonas sp.]|nr:hypothetical protein [Pseudoalteromonas sp.]|tara:strand:+ start:3314 stop:6010 length:2697 start_codon:yes stop_codon:yes gene_type:complete
MSKFLLWIGAGEAQSLNFNYADFNKVIFVDPLLRVSSFSNLGDEKKFVFLNKAVTPNVFEVKPFTVFNNEEFSSFLEPKGLKNLYPNLALEEVQGVETTTITGIVKEYNVTGNANTLVLELPCLSGDLLDELKSKGILNLFNSIVVSAGKKPLYANSNDIQVIVEKLTSEYYEFTEDLGEDEDICTYRFVFNPMLQHIAALQNEVLDLTAQLKLVASANQQVESDKDEMEALLSNSQVAFREIQVELQAVQTELQVAAEKAQSSETQVSALKNEKDELNAQLTEDNKTTAQQISLLESQIKSLSAQLKTVESANQQADSDKAELKALLSNSQQAFSEVQAEIHAVTEKAQNSEAQISALKNEKDKLNAQLIEANKKIEKYNATIHQQEEQLLAEQKGSQQLCLENEELKANKAAAAQQVLSLERQIESLSAQLKTLESVNQQAESDKAELETLLSNSQEAFSKAQTEIHEAAEKAQNSETQISALKNEKYELSAQLIEANKEIEQHNATIYKQEEQLRAELQKSQQYLGDNESLQANEKVLEATINNLQVSFEQSKESHINEIQELNAKLKACEEKQKETHGWFVSRKQQAEALSKEVEALKRENALLVSSKETASAVGELEQKLTSLLNKQSEDNIEIANALGKHVTRCHEEQKSNIASQLELRKLSALSRLPISIDSRSMDAPNLAELSSLIALNNYDVIIEFGSGLSTVVAASALQDRSAQQRNSDNLLNETSNISDIANALPKHIVSFEESYEHGQKTKELLCNAGVDAYVELCHAPLVSVPSIDGSFEGALFYDCAEKLLELKRTISADKARVLVIVTGGANESDEAQMAYWALPLVLDYLSRCSLTLFLNNNANENSDLSVKWKGESKRRRLAITSEHLNTPKGATIFNIQP